MDESNTNQPLSTKALSGFMELLPAEQLAFNRILDTIRKTYETFGFTPIETPILERANVLLAKAGGETEKQIYSFLKGDTELAMRFDHTVPLARYVAEHQGHLTFPFRRYAIGKVYRGERPQAGRFREFYQCDVDVVGDGELGLQYDAEMPSIIATIFTRLGFEKFVVRINNRKVLNGLFAGLGVEAQSVDIMRAIDRLEKVGVNAVHAELNELGLVSEVIERLMNFMAIAGSTDEVLTQLGQFGIDHETFASGVAELTEVVALTRSLKVSEEHFTVDLTIARGLDYYTGTVYETQLTDYPEIGSVCSGGRYENLSSHYTDRSLPGVGVSIGLTRLFDQLRKRELVTVAAAVPTKVLVVSMLPEANGALELAAELRAVDIPTEVWYGSDKLKKSFGYADKQGIPYVALLGEDEQAAGVYTLKELTSGEQQQLDLTALIAALQG